MSNIQLAIWLLLIVIAFALAFTIAAVTVAVWKNVHSEELLRLRRFRDDVAFEAAISEAGISSEMLQSMIEHRKVAR